MPTDSGFRAGADRAGGDASPVGSPAASTAFNSPTVSRSQDPMHNKAVQPAAPDNNHAYVWIDTPLGGMWSLHQIAPSGGGTGEGNGNDGAGSGSVGTGTQTGVITPGGSRNADPNALQIITDGLAQVGLGALAANAWDMWNRGMDMNAILNDPNKGIRASDVYKARFPGMAALNAKGQGISEQQYIDKENADRGLLYQYLGDSAHLYDNHDALGKIISGFKSTAELQSDLQAAHDAVIAAPPETIQWLKDNYGMTQGDLTAFWLNPDVAETDIQRRAAAGQLGGIAAKSGFGNLSTTQADQLALQGVSDAQARQGFAQIGVDGQLRQALPGDETGTVTQQQLLDATFSGNADAIAAVNRLRQARVGQFQDGGQFATDSHGVAGLGLAETR